LEEIRQQKSCNVYEKSFGFTKGIGNTEWEESKRGNGRSYQSYKSADGTGQNTLDKDYEHETGEKKEARNRQEEIEENVVKDEQYTFRTRGVIICVGKETKCKSKRVKELGRESGKNPAKDTHFLSLGATIPHRSVDERSWENALKSGGDNIKENSKH